MANIPELQEAILQALDAVVTQRNNDLKLDKTIVAIIKKNIGLRHGKAVYQVEYSGGIIEAICQNVEDVYVPKTSVYVLVPQGDFSKEKIIIGRASSIVTDRSASIIAAAVNQFSIVGSNLLLGKDDNIKDIQFGLRSFHPISADNKVYHNKGHRYQILYDISDSENKIIFDNERLNIYKEDSTALMVRADFLTNLDIAQRRKSGARYGLIFNFVFENLNKGYGTTNGEILENISKDIVFINDNEESKTVYQLGEDFISAQNNNLNEWVRENTGSIDMLLEWINVAYSNFKEKYPEKNTDIVAATMLAYQIAISELKNCESVSIIKKNYNEWKKTAVGELEDKTISYTWTSDDMIGNPMTFNIWNSQYQVFNIDFETLSHLESIAFFKEGFIENEQYEQKWPASEADVGGGPDIFVKNLQIYAMNPIDIQSGDYTLKVESDSGYDIVFDTTSNNEEIRLKATLTRKMYEDLSGNSNTSYIWFKEDSSVVNAQSPNYHSLGGIGWRKISEGTSSSRFITLNSSDNQAYKNNYKCIAIYEPSTDDKAILAYPFIVYNSAAKIDIMLESDLGTHFSYDAGAPTIRVLIKDTDNNDEFIEKGYSLTTLNPKYIYKWAIADSANNYTLFLDEILNDDTPENAMLSSIKQAQLNKIKKFIWYDGVVTETEESKRATRIKYPVSISSTGFTVTCYVQKIKDIYAEEAEYIDVGSASLEFLNQADSITSDYRIEIVNGDQVFQYDEYGKTPTSTSKKDPLEILPLQTKLFTPSGIEVSGSNYQVEWIFPIENTLIKKLEDTPFLTNPATNLPQLIKGHEINFDIAEIYDPNAYANQITCHVSFGGRDYYKDTNFYFGKQGNNGTNGTDVIAKIEYIGASSNDDLTILNREPLILYLQKTDNNNNNKMFNVDKKWWSDEEINITADNKNNRGLKLKLYQKNTEIAPTICKWNIAGNPKETINDTSKWFKLNSINEADINESSIVSNQIVFNDIYNNNKVLIQNLRAKAEVKEKNDNQTYYAFYSLPIIQYEKSNIDESNMPPEEELIEDVTNLLSINRISIDKHFYLNEVVYNADGRNPIYNHNQGLKLINIPNSIKKIIFTVKGGLGNEKTPCVRLLKDRNNQHDEGLDQIIIERNEENLILWNIVEELEEDNQSENISMEEPMVYILPDDTYDGSKTNNRIEAKLYKENELLVATVFAPINMTLNTFGLASLNAWDGNSVTIDDENGYVMAPQIGAGEKDNNNRFTGILMGKTETYTGGGDNEEEIGLFGYSQGLQSIFLDAKTGNATFGLPDVVGFEYNDKNEIIPGSGNYKNTNIEGNDDYNEGRIELRPGEISKIGGWRLGRTSLYYVTDFDYGHEKKEDEEGYEEEEDHYYKIGLGEVGKPYRNDYVPVPKTGEVKQDNEKLDYTDHTDPNAEKTYYKGYYNQYHVKDIPHKSSGILLQAGEYPYISIKGKPLSKNEVKEMNKINNSLNDSSDSEKLYQESDSYLKEGDSLEIQLDPSAPSLFSIFRHNGSDRYEQKIDDVENPKLKYEADTRTFLAGINGKGEFVANSISNVTTTLPALINDADNFSETSYTTNFAVNTIPAFNDYKASPTHIGFKMDVGNNILGQLFISATGIDPVWKADKNEIKFWNIDDYNEEKRSIQTDRRESGQLIKDPTLRISGGRVDLDQNDINSYGEYIRPIALHGRSISLFGYPTDFDDARLNSKVAFSNNHFILETDANHNSKAQLSLGDNINGSSNTFIHLKGYDDTGLNEEKISGSQINIATDLHKNIGIFNESNKRIDYLQIINANDPDNPEYKELWKFGSDRYIRFGSEENPKYINKWYIYPDVYIKQNNTYQSVKDFGSYYKHNDSNSSKEYYVSKNIIDNKNSKGSILEDFYYYKINNKYILASEFNRNVYINENKIIGENIKVDNISLDYYWYVSESSNNLAINNYYFIKKEDTSLDKIYRKARKKDNTSFYYYKDKDIDTNDMYYYIIYNNGTTSELVSKFDYDNNNLYPYIKLKNKDNNEDFEYCHEDDLQNYGYEYKGNNISFVIDKYIIESAILFEQSEEDKYTAILEKDAKDKWDCWYESDLNDEKLNNVYLKVKNPNYSNSENNEEVPPTNEETPTDGEAPDVETPNNDDGEAPEIETPNDDNNNPQNKEEYIYILLKEINPEKIYYLNNKYCQKIPGNNKFYYIKTNKIMDENENIHEEKIYKEINSFAISNKIYYKYNNDYISDIDWDTNYYKDSNNNSNNYFSSDEIDFSNEYKKNGSQYEIVDTNNSDTTYYRTFKLKLNTADKNKLRNIGWNKDDKYYLFLIKGTKISEQYDKSKNYDNDKIDNSKIYYLINNEIKTDIDKYKKVKEESGNINYLKFENEDQLEQEYVIDSNGKHIAINNIVQKTSIVTIPTKAEYYMAGKIEANIGTTVDTYTTLQISDDEVSLKNQKTQPIIIDTPNSGFLLNTITGELSFNKTNDKYETLFTSEAQPIKSKLIIKSNDQKLLNYGLLLMDNSFALKSSNYGEISTSDNIWITSSDIGKDQRYSRFNPQILLRAGTSTGVIPNRDNAQSELILNSSSTRWNGLMTNENYDTDVYNFPIFAVRTSGGNIGIYPEYFNDRTIYRENFVVNMNQSISNGLGIQGIYKGICEVGPDMLCTRNEYNEAERQNPYNNPYKNDHYMGIESAYSIRTQNYVFAQRFMGDGTWINKTTDLSNNNYDKNSFTTAELGNEGEWKVGTNLTLKITGPSLNISEGRLHSINSSSEKSVILTLDSDIATKTWVGKQNFAKKSDVNTVIERLNELIRAYDSHKHNYVAPKADAAGDPADTHNFNGGIQTLGTIK